MECDSCHNKEASRLSYGLSGKCSCDKCGSLVTFRFSDVYFKGAYFEPNLGHDTTAPLGQMVHTREHKAALMKELGVRESGDKVHGAR